MVWGVSTVAAMYFTPSEEVAREKKILRRKQSHKPEILVDNSILVHFSATSIPTVC